MSAIQRFNIILTTASLLASTTTAIVTYKNSIDIKNMNKSIKQLNRELNYTKHELIQIDNSLEMTCVNIENLTKKIKRE